MPPEEESAGAGARLPVVDGAALGTGVGDAAAVVDPRADGASGAAGTDEDGRPALELELVVGIALPVAAAEGRGAAVSLGIVAGGADVPDGTAATGRE